MAAKQGTQELGFVGHWPVLEIGKWRSDRTYRYDIREKVAFLLVIVFEPTFTLYYGRIVQRPVAFDREQLGLCTFADLFPLSIHYDLNSRTNFSGESYCYGIAVAIVCDPRFLQYRCKVIIFP